MPPKTKTINLPTSSVYGMVDRLSVTKVSSSHWILHHRLFFQSLPIQNDEPLAIHAKETSVLGPMQ